MQKGPQNTELKCNSVLRSGFSSGPNPLSPGTTPLGAGGRPPHRRRRLAGEGYCGRQAETTVLPPFLLNGWEERWHGRHSTREISSRGPKAGRRPPEWRHSRRRHRSRTGAVDDELEGRTEPTVRRPHNPPPSSSPLPSPCRLEELGQNRRLSARSRKPARLFRRAPVDLLRELCSISPLATFHHGRTTWRRRESSFESPPAGVEDKLERGKPAEEKMPCSLK